MRNISYILFSLLFLSSCSFYQIDSSYTSGNYYPSKDSTENITYIDNLKEEKTPNEIIGSVVVNVERRQSLEGVVEQMKKEAARMGGDAITNIRTNDGTGRWAKIKPKRIFGNANIRSNYIADVVSYLSSAKSSEESLESPQTPLSY